MWFAISLVVLSADPALPAANQRTSKTPTFVCTCRQQVCSCSRNCRSGNFTAYCYTSRFHAGEIAQSCEMMRRQFQERWFGEVAGQDWVPPCQIVLHATRQSYLAAVGREAGSTSGCSTIQTDQQRVVVRRIDLLGEDAGRAISALSHELTHVVLADRFSSQPLPRWADEGMATLADSADKQNRHRRDLDEAVRRGTVLRLGTLLTLESYPPQEQVPVFYGQSVSLVSFLCQRKPSPDFLHFIESGRRVGFDAALRSCYEIDGVAQLESLWRESLLRRDVSGTR